MNELQEKIESNVITKTFHIAGMPETFWKEINTYCRDNYGDVRWVMLQDLFKATERDYKFEMLYSRIEELEVLLSQLQEEVEGLKKKEVKPKKSLPTFG